ncbi:MAG: tetratricopeptide repeat protein [Xenococcaceae cyanobacterium]
MFEQVADAIKRKDYQTAAGLLKRLMQREPENPWVQFYMARLDEATGKLEAADKVYRQLLRTTNNLKIISQARQGVGRLAEIQQKQRQQALAQAKSQPGSDELGVLVLEPIHPELKKTAAQKFARIMQLDVYSARLQLPSRSWRLYRTGSVGELRFYISSLREAEIPCFCAPITEIGQLNVYQVNYFQSIAPQATVICQNEQGQQGTLNFDWSEVSRLVEGLIPLFEKTLEIGVRRKLQRKTKTLDYAQFCDLHLPERKSILRLCDQNYEFQQGMTFSPKPESAQAIGQTTTRSNWNNLNKFLNQQLPEIPVWSDFTAFASTAMDFREMLKHIEPHINLFRREETPWDAAFELYSGLVFLRGAQGN